MVQSHRINWVYFCTSFELCPKSGSPNIGSICSAYIKKCIILIIAKKELLCFLCIFGFILDLPLNGIICSCKHRIWGTRISWNFFVSGLSKAGSCVIYLCCDYVYCHWSEFWKLLPPIIFLFITSNTTRHQSALIL